jgi:hypothetical protein
MSLFESASLVVTPNGTKASKLYAIKPTSGAGDLSVTRATTATRVNSAGLIESVAVNVPRLDYTNSNCPSILVEPQRTNLITYSEDLTNVSWDKYGGQIITANNAISPDGNLTADKMTSTGGVYKNATFSGNTDYSISVFIKKDTATSFGIEFVDQMSPFRGGGIDYTFSNNNIAVYQSENGSVSGSYVNYPNNYVRLTLKFKTSNIVTFNYQQFNFSGGTGWAWGFSLEAGSYATSYIPTVASAVTRNADVISKTGISSLIGQTEGTLFIDVNLNKLNGSATNQYLMQIHQDASNRILIFRTAVNNLNFYFLKGTNVFFSDTTISANGRHKIAVAYKSGTSAFYIDGVLIDTYSTSFSAFTSISGLDLGVNNSSGAAADIGDYPYNSSILWKTRLTNAELAELTTL